MKFYKRQSIDNHNPMSGNLAYTYNGLIISSSTASLQLPTGETADRPGDTNRPIDNPMEGYVRYNTDLNDIEAYVRGQWERVRTVRPAELNVQNLGNGNYEDTTFGPLNPDYAPSQVKSSANTMVYVDNVYQIPVTNYNTTPTPGNITRTLTQITPISTGTLPVNNNTTNIINGMNVTGIGITTGTVVTGRRTVTTTTPTTTTVLYVDISLPTTVQMTTGTTVVFSYNTGNYLVFTGTVPSKPVVAIHGYDGYFPPG
jgi:hypothetical protein